MPKSNIAEKGLIRQRRQLLKMSLTVTLVFGACVFPASVGYGCSSPFSTCKPNRAWLFGILLLFISYVVNPFIFALHSSNYRHGYKTDIDDIDCKISFQVY